MLYSQKLRIWDFWTATDHEIHHIFYLKAPRIGNPQDRHDQAVIGHAISRDWSQWAAQPDALTPAASPAWDDLSLWTGSIIPSHGGDWLMFYTGRDKLTRTQNIGMARSNDLVHWKRIGTKPIFMPDAHWYRMPTEESPERYTWRDPYAVYDVTTDNYYLFFSAHAQNQKLGCEGAIGAAVSKDLNHWTVLPPVLNPGWIRDMEVPSVIQKDGVWFLFCSVKAEWYGADAPIQARTTTLCFQSSTILGPYTLHPMDNRSSDLWYASRPVFDNSRGWMLMGWRMGAEEGHPEIFRNYAVDDPKPLSCVPESKVDVI